MAKKATQNEGRESAKANEASVADTGENRRAIAEVIDLAELAGEADRIVVATVPKGWGEDLTKSLNCGKAIETLKGDHSSVGLSITLGERDEGVSKEEGRRWVLFLREDGDGRGVPALYPVRRKGWFMPYSEEPVKKIEAAIVLPKEWGRPVKGLKMGLRLRKGQFGIGEPIRVEVCIKNDSQGPVTIGQHRYNIYDYFEFTCFEVTTPSGQILRLGKPATLILEDDFAGPRALAAGETYVRTIRVDKWPTRDEALGGSFREKGPGVFGEPGKYTIRCLYTNPRPEIKQVWSGELVSNKVQLEIVAAKKPETGLFPTSWRGGESTTNRLNAFGGYPKL